MILYNMGSILCGLLAWFLPVAALAGRGRLPRGAYRGLTVLSFALCALALWIQLLDTERLVALGDWSALMDTQNVISFAAGVLLAVTALLNAAVWWSARRAQT